jgi:cell division protein FtsA
VERTVVGIDVGTTKICTLVGEADAHGDLRIVGVGVVPSRGLRKGVVVDLNEATSAIAASVRKAERISGYDIASAYVSVAGEHISAINSRGVVAVARAERGINSEDVDRALEAAQAIAIPHNREVIHVIPRGYTLDGQDGVRDPLGMQGYRLEVEAHIVTGATATMNNLTRCVENAGVSIDGLVLEPLASGEAVLTQTEREMGVVLADIGGGTTGIAILIEGSVWHTIVIPTGGEHLTNDIAVGLRTPPGTAEELKIRHGQAMPNGFLKDEPVEVAAFGDATLQTVSRELLTGIIQARMEEIFTLIRQEIKRSGYDGLLPAGLVLCGGAAELAGAKELGREVLDLPVRVGAPHDLQGLVDVLESPAYATSVGLLLWGLKRQPSPLPSTRNGWLDGVGNWLKAFLPG